MKNIIIVGTGGLAREFCSFFSFDSKLVNVIGFTSTNREEHQAFSLPGALFEDEITPDIVGTDQVVIAIGNPAIRKRISVNLRLLGFCFPSFVHPSSTVSHLAEIGEGVVISPNCIVSPNVQLKDFCFLNFGVGVGHDATVGNYSQINPGAQIGGFSRIGHETSIGSGSTILQGVKIGNNVTIASGSVVFSRVADGVTMMGNPAKRMRAFEN